MSAFVEHAFKRGFILDEATLLKLHELIQARLGESPTTIPLSFTVYRGDSYSYETQSVEDVVNEENEDWRAITRLDLVAVLQDVEFKLTFSVSDNSPTLRIIGDDRDQVFLLFSDVRDYVTNEVLAGVLPDRDIFKIVALMGMTIPLVAALVWFGVVTSSSSFDSDTAAKVLSGNDLQSKIDLLIRDRMGRDFRITPLILLLGIGLLAPVLGSAGVILKSRPIRSR